MTTERPIRRPFCDLTPGQRQRLIALIRELTSKPYAPEFEGSYTDDHRFRLILSRTDGSPASVEDSWYETDISAMHLYLAYLRNGDAYKISLKRAGHDDYNEYCMSFEPIVERARDLLARVAARLAVATAAAWHRLHRTAVKTGAPTSREDAPPPCE